MIKKIQRLIIKVIDMYKNDGPVWLIALILDVLWEKIRSPFKLQSIKVPHITRQMNQTIGVVIPCKNHAEYLIEAIDSVYSNKTEIVIHSVIVNDGSTDDTDKKAAMIMEKYPNVQYVYHPQSMGLPAARNAGISKLNTDYILCLDADDKIPDNYIQSCCELLATCDIAYNNMQCFGASDRLCRVPEFNKTFLKRQNFIHCSAIYRKSMWSKLNGYDETMKIGWEDYEFWIHAYLNGYTFRKNHDTFLYYRKHKSSLLTTSIMNAPKLQGYLKSKYPDFYIGKNSVISS